MSSDYKNDSAVGNAIAKLNDTKEAAKATSNKAEVVLPFVREALIGFCEQNAEFADAIVQSDKTLGECCESIMKNVGNSISDLKVYAKAAAFYFPGCEIDMKMTIRMSKFEKAEEEKKLALTLDLFDPLDLL